MINNVTIEGSEITRESIDEAYFLIEEYLESGPLAPDVYQSLHDRFTQARDSLYLEVAGLPVSL